MTGKFCPTSAPGWTVRQASRLMVRSPEFRAIQPRSTLGSELGEPFAPLRPVQTIGRAASRAPECPLTWQFSAIEKHTLARARTTDALVNPMSELTIAPDTETTSSAPGAAVRIGPVSKVSVPPSPASARKIPPGHHSKVSCHRTPLKGFSNHDSPDGHIHDPSLPPPFAEYAKQVMPANVDVQVLDAHFNDPEFADAIVARAREVLKL